MRINEISKRFNISLTKLRYYEKVGLFDKVKRVNGIREYEDKDIERLKIILSLKGIGLTIKEILQYLELEQTEAAEQQKNILICHRNKILKEIHSLHKNLEYIDYFIYRCNYKNQCV